MWWLALEVMQFAHAQEMIILVILAMQWTDQKKKGIFICEH